MIPTVPVSFEVIDQNGVPVANAIVVVKLNRMELFEGLVVPDRVETTADANGAGVIQLWPNALGSRASAYEIRIWGPDKKQKYLDAEVVVPNVPCNLHEILVLAPFAPLSPAVLAAAQLKQATVEAVIAKNSANASATSALDSKNASSSSMTVAIDNANVATTKANEATVSAVASAASAATADAQRVTTEAARVASLLNANNALGSANAAAASSAAATNQAGISATQASNSAASAASSQASRLASEAARDASAASAATADAQRVLAQAARTGAELAEANAEAAEAAASASAASAAASLDAFDDRYLGARSSDPLVDNDGSALLTGALYYRTTVPIGMKVYSGSSWLAAASAAAPSTFIETLLDDATAAAARSTLGVINARGLFFKPDTTSVAFTKTGAGTLSVKAGTIVDVLGTSVTFATATAIVMPALTGGTDYAIYACTDGTVRADSSFTAPTGYTIANSRLIGGFHYGLVAPGTTVAGGSFNTAGSVQTGGMVWTQPDVDKIAGVNLYSLWDLRWRANVADLRAQRGFVLTDAGTWVAIYFTGTDTDTNGLSRNNVAVASGTVLPRIPATMGGNGALTYADYNWWRVSEHARAYGARLLTEAEANIAFFGVTENQSLGGASSTIPLTTRQPGYTSKYGIEQATGHIWIWGDDSAGAIATGFVENGGRGQSYANTVIKVLLGGSRGSSATTGSRLSSWNGGPTYSNWNVGLRAAVDHLMLA